MSLADGPTSQLVTKYWLDEASISDIDHFIKTLSGIKAKGVQPDLIGSIITHYACKWIPELSDQPASPTHTDDQLPPESATASWLKKRFFIETIVSVLPPEKDAVPCGFLLRLLKTANMVGAGSNYRDEVEKRVAWRLDQATMKEVMIPCFSHVKGTLLDVELMVRLVKRFVEINLEGLRSGAGLFKVAKLVDAYLAEAAVDSELALPEFMELAGAVPAQARSTDDGLYRAIDTYLKLHSHINWSRPISNPKSPNLGLDLTARCNSSRDIITLQQMEIKQLKEHVNKLDRQCHLMQSQIDKLLEKKKGFFSWRKLATSTTLGVVSVEVADGRGGGKGYDSGSIGKQTPVKGKQGRSKTPKPWRQSTS
ncbi:hypothetical protein E3N88_42488 [Mikania micrantha]|uniref:NPH3 domain-containing protein n=1 Tax=Mikania micrantha TaxID=192012 RepID=A0A5N6LHQ0_9ASTR|nr:hypothetical protein E3N88_42488 [Mikania micrantha]